jgi:quercetin dioxygenase-like cupin family protein
LNFFELKGLEPLLPSEGVEIRIIPGERMTMAFFSIQPGSEIPEHAHPHEQMGTVLKGSVELTIGDEKRTVTPGTAYRVPPDVPHSGRCGDAPAEVIEVFSPIREDFQKS